MRAHKFTLADAMILVAATAVGLAALRVQFEGLSRVGPRPNFNPDPDYNAWLWRRYRLVGAGLVLLAWSAADLLLFSLPPRRSARRLARSAGFAACLASVLGLGLLMLFQGRSLINCVREEVLVSSLWVYVAMLPGLVGPGVASAWLMLALAGRWRLQPDQDWRDRAGRRLGWCWLALYLSIEIPWVIPS